MGDRLVGIRALERELQQQLFESEDAQEGLRAYLAKAKPTFRGA